MKINPPDPIVDEKEPFKEALFGRQKFGESLTALLRNVEDNLVVFIDAPWGEGKTTFARMWLAHLRDQKLEAIYFDAYAADYHDDPFVSFSGEIVSFAKENLEPKKALLATDEFKKKAVEVGKKMAGLAFKVGIRAATMGIVAGKHLKEAKEIAAESLKGIGEIGSEIIEKSIANYAEEKDSLRKFKNSLKKLAAIFREEHGFPLTIVVDELDRCRPDFALELLERIKHLFDVKGVAFVLLVNRNQIESYIRTIYGQTVDAHSYLLKFANVFLDLPKQLPPFPSEYAKTHETYCDQLFEYHGLNDGTEERRHLNDAMVIFSLHFDLTLREIERSFSTVVLFYVSLVPGGLADEHLIPLLSVIKIKRPSLFKKLKTGTLSSQDFLQETSLDKLKAGMHTRLHSEWIASLIDFCLMTDSELQTALSTAKGTHPSLSTIYRYYSPRLIRLKRNDLIPYFCSRLEQFDLKSK